MTDVIFDNLENISFIFAILVAFVTLVFVFNRLGVWFNSKCIKPLINRIFVYYRDKEIKKINILFGELKPMINAQVKFTLQEYQRVLNDQQVTLQSSISESVEFKSFVNKNMIALQKSIETLVVVVTKNSEDYEKVRICLDTISKRLQK